MHKRIVELADQILPNEKEFHKGDPNEWGFFFSGKELENFAELIVRECVDRCRELGNAGVSGHEVARVLEKHFGVE